MGFLESACRGDQSLLSEVSSLLDCDDSNSQFLEKPALESTLFNLNSSSSSSLVGRRIGPYEIVELLGRGGMGEVYKAKDLSLGRIDALKVLPPLLALDPERLKRFNREAKAAGSLTHRNIATIYAVGEAEGLRYIAMEYVAGQTLEDKIGGHPLPFSTLLDFGAQLANALAEAHTKGVVHRDLNPSNILVTPEGQIKVLDFGIAKISHAPEQSASSPGSPESATAMGMIMGTLEFMSPEQLLGQKVDQRTDIFALGAVLYHMATGRPPFKGTNIAKIMEQILSSPASLDQTPPAGATKELWRLILRCLEKTIENRYPSMSPLVKEFAGMAQQESQKDRGTAKFGRPSFIPRIRGKLGWMILVTLLLTLIAIWTYNSRKQWLGGSPYFSNRPSRIAIVLWSMEKSPENTQLKNLILQKIILALSQKQTSSVVPFELMKRYSPKETNGPELLEQTKSDLYLQIWLESIPQNQEYSLFGICYGKNETVQWQFMTTVKTDQFEAGIEKLVTLIQKEISNIK